MKHLTPIIHSPLQRRDQFDNHTLQVCIYKRAGADWTLRVMNCAGSSKIWTQTFETDLEALAAYEHALAQGGIEFVSDFDSLLDGIQGFNIELLRPRYEQFREPLSRLTYTLCTFELLNKYAGIWPAQDLHRHDITGYLYSGPAPKWPHPPKGLPGAPENIDTEFTVPPQHIRWHLNHDRRFTKTNDWSAYA